MRFLLALSSVLLLLLLLPGTSAAQWSTDPTLNTPVCLNADGNSMQFVRTCADGSGGAILVWGDRRKEKTNTGGDIFAQRLNVDGVPQWTLNGVAICDTTGEQNMPCIVSDNAGGAFIVWVDARTGQYTGNIYAQHVNGSGQVLWERQGRKLTPGTANNFFNPAIAADGSGGFFLSYRVGVTPAGIIGQHVGSDGSLLWTTSGVTVSPAGYHDSPVIAPDDSGGVFICWTFTRSDGYLNSYIQRLTSAGVKRYTANGVPFRAQAAMQGRNQLLSMGRGEAMTAWYDERDASGIRIAFVQRFSWNGTPLLTAGGKRVTDGSADAYYIAMAPDGLGGVFLAYLNYNVLRAIALKGNGVARWDSSACPILCNAANDRYLGPIILNKTGRAVVAWADNRNGTFSNPNFDCFAQTIDTLGRMEWTTNGSPITTAPRSQYGPVLVQTDYQSVIAAWFDDRHGTTYSSFTVYAQRINAYGGLNDVAPGDPLPQGIALMQNYPNPFNPSTEIRFAVSTSSHVTLAVFDLIGREVATLLRERREAGEYSERFDGTGLSSGIYICRLQAGNATRSVKMLLVR